MGIEILAFGAHPDDVECAASGVILNTVAQGGKVVLVDMTKGEMGTFGDETLRAREGEAARRILGIYKREQLDFGDARIEDNYANRLEVIRMIRKYRPKIVLANAVSDRHPDHGVAAQLVAKASFLSGLKRIETTDVFTLQEPWRPKAVYHYIQDEFITPDIVVDISMFFEDKMKAIKAFESQFTIPDNSDERLPTLLQQISNTNQIFGRAINVMYGEGFTSARYIGTTDLLSLL